MEKKFENEISQLDKGTRSVVHESSKEFGRMLHEQLQEFTMILTKKYHYSFPAEFFKDYHGSFNKEEFLKMEQPKEKARSRGADSLPISNVEWKKCTSSNRIIKEECNISDDIGGEWHYPKGICDEQINRAAKAREQSEIVEREVHIEGNSSKHKEGGVVDMEEKNVESELQKNSNEQDEDVVELPTGADGLIVGEPQHNDRNYSIEASKPGYYDFVEPPSLFCQKLGVKMDGRIGTENRKSVASSALEKPISVESQMVKFFKLSDPGSPPIGAATSHYEEEEPFESLEGIEAQTIGKPSSNGNDLLSGVTDGVDYVPQSKAGDDTKDLDFFGSVGELDLGKDSFPPGLGDTKVFGGYPYCHSGGSISLIYGEHPHGEQPSQTLFIRNINNNVKASKLRSAIPSSTQIESKVIEVNLAAPIEVLVQVMPVTILGILRTKKKKPRRRKREKEIEQKMKVGVG